MDSRMTCFWNFLKRKSEAQKSTTQISQRHSIVPGSKRFSQPSQRQPPKKNALNHDDWRIQTIGMFKQQKKHVFLTCCQPSWQKLNKPCGVLRSAHVRLLAQKTRRLTKKNTKHVFCQFVLVATPAAVLVVLVMAASELSLHSTSQYLESLEEHIYNPDVEIAIVHCCGSFRAGIQIWYEVYHRTYGMDGLTSKTPTFNLQLPAMSLPNHRRDGCGKT